MGLDLLSCRLIMLIDFIKRIGIARRRAIALEIAVPGGRVRAEQFGKKGGAPLVVIHGGPGFPHYYLLPLAALSRHRPVIFYDQLGCGSSERPDDDSLWTVKRFTVELANVVKAVSKQPVHLLGHSWGAVLAGEFYSLYPERTASVVFASPSLSIPRWREDAERRKNELEPKFRAVLEQAEGAGDFYSPAYQQALEEYYRRFVYRIDPIPRELQQAIDGFGPAAYRTLWGPNERVINGKLADYDYAPRLKQIKRPVLFTCGEYDEVIPASAQLYADETPGAQLAVFKQSAHLPHLSESTAYQTTLGNFLNSADRLAVSRAAGGC